MLEKTLFGSRGEREVQVLVRLRGLSGEAGAQLLQQQREVLLVFGAEGMARAGHSGIFPVDVQPVEIVFVRNSITLWMNTARLSGVSATSEKLVDHSQPPRKPAR